MLASPPASAPASPSIPPLSSDFARLRSFMQQATSIDAEFPATSPPHGPGRFVAELRLARASSPDHPNGLRVSLQSSEASKEGRMMSEYEFYENVSELDCQILEIEIRDLSQMRRAWSRQESPAFLVVFPSNSSVHLPSNDFKQQKSAREAAGYIHDMYAAAQHKRVVHVGAGATDRSRDYHKRGKRQRDCLPMSPGHAWARVIVELHERTSYECSKPFSKIGYHVPVDCKGSEASQCLDGSLESVWERAGFRLASGAENPSPLPTLIASRETDALPWSIVIRAESHVSPCYKNHHARVEARSKMLSAALANALDALTESRRARRCADPTVEDEEPRTPRVAPRVARAGPSSDFAFGFPSAAPPDLIAVTTPTQQPKSAGLPKRTPPNAPRKPSTTARRARAEEHVSFAAMSVTSRACSLILAVTQDEDIRRETLDFLQLEPGFIHDVTTLEDAMVRRLALLEEGRKPPSNNSWMRPSPIMAQVVALPEASVSENNDTSNLSLTPPSAAYAATKPMHSTRELFKTPTSRTSASILVKVENYSNLSAEPPRMNSDRGTNVENLNEKR